MKYLQIDSGSIIAYPEQVELVALGVDIAAGPASLLLHKGLAFVLLEVIPEKTSLKLHLEPGKPGQYLFQRLSQQSGVYLFFQCYGNTEYIAQVFIGYHGKYLTCVIQPVPPFSLGILFHSAPFCRPSRRFPAGPAQTVFSAIISLSSCIHNYIILNFCLSHCFCRCFSHYFCPPCLLLASFVFTPDMIYWTHTPGQWRAAFKFRRKYHDSSFISPKIGV